MTSDVILKKCPICGSEPRGIFYTSYPPQYGFSHCGIESGCCKSIHEAKEKWNEQVYLYQQKQNKLTDEQIIKALEYCSSSDLGQCRNCPFYEQCENDEQLVKYTLDLIKRKDAVIEQKDIEIDILIKKKEALRDEICELQAENERYEKTVGTLATKKDGTVIATLNGNKTEYIPKKLHKIFKNMAVNRAKSEAIKEFAERLKEQVSHIPAWGSVADKKIDNLVKEMVGEKDV